MATRIESQGEIPKAPYYVCATDTFMSGWGPATGRVNRLILPCADLADAMVVKRNARNRTDMKRVTICSRKPKLQPHGYYYQVMLPDECDRWHEPGGFTR